MIMNQDQPLNPNSSPKTKLREQDTFVYQPIDSGGEALEFASQAPVFMPVLPSVKSLNQFILLAKDVVKLPEKKPPLTAHDSGTLSLDDMLEEAQILDIQRFPELISLGIELIQSIDSRCFVSSPGAMTPFQALTQQADLAKELAVSVKRGMQEVSKYFTLDFETLMQRVMLAIDYHRGDAIHRRVEAIEVSGRLVSWEICFDAGVPPAIPKQDMRIFDDVDKEQSPRREGPTSDGEGKKSIQPRKQINYGRDLPDKSLTNEEDTEADVMARRSEDNNEQLRKKLEVESRVDQRSFLHQNDREETKSFTERVRKGKTRHEMFGTLKIALETAKRREDSDAIKKLEAKLPAWISQAMLVSGSSIERADARPFFQNIAEQLVQIGTKIIQFSEISLKKDFVSSEIKIWSVKQLEERLKNAVKLHRAYSHVIEVMEAVAPKVKESGLTEVLDERRKVVIDILSPQLQVLSPEDNPIFNGYMLSRKDAAQEMKIELLARSLVLQNIDAKLRQFTDESPDKMSYARELARKRLGIE